MSTMSGSSQLPETPAPGNSMLSSVLHRHMHTHAPGYISMCTNGNKNKTLKGNK